MRWQLRHTFSVDENQINQFNELGATVVRGLFTPDEVATIERGIEKNLAAPGPMFKVASKPDDPGRFVEDFCNWNRIDEYRTIAFESRAADVAQQLMGGTSVRLFHDHMLVKEPGTKQETPWHQDQPYYNVDGHINCSMWAPVDPVPIESTLEFHARSHKRGWLMPRTFVDDQARWFPEGSMSEIPQIEADRSGFDILGWELAPGDAVFFHMLTTHHSYGVSGTNRRRALSLRFLGDDMVHAPRDWITSPNFDAINLEIVAGAPMVHELFPLLRLAASEKASV